MIMNGLRNLRTNLVAAGAMVVASAAICVSPAIAADYVGTADDLTQLQQLLAKYANSLDGDNPEGYASVFTEDGVWHAGIGERYRCIKGRAAIADLARGETERLSAPGQYPHSHMTVLGKVTFDDKDHAHSHQTNIIVGSQGFVQALKGGADIFYTGYYNDTFERVNGRWLISNRDEFSGHNPATGIHDLKYHPPRECPPDSSGTAASTTTSAAPAKPTGYVGTADDLTQLQQLLAKYANSLDGDNPEGYASVFTEDGVWHSGVGERYRCIKGHAAIADLARGETERTSAPGQSPRSHMTLLGYVTFDDKDHAHSHQTNILVGSQGFVQALKAGAGLFYTGYYNDTFERVNGRWLISNRDEFSGHNPATGIHDVKYHPPRKCPPDSTGTAASTTTSAAPAKPTGYVGTADDLTQLQQVLAQYANSLDGDDPEGYASAFTENGIWHSGVGERYRCIKGHAAIADLARGETERTSAPGQSPRSHMTVLGYVTFDDKDHAHSHQTNILVGSQGFVQALKAGAGLFYTGYYNDTFERVNGRWLISNRDEFSGYDPATGIHDLKYHPPRTCPANNPPPPPRQN
jgi:hypothetical protein